MEAPEKLLGGFEKGYTPERTTIRNNAWINLMSATM